MKIVSKLIVASIYASLVLLLLGCSNNKQNKNETNPGTDTVRADVRTGIKPEIINTEKLRNIISDRQGKPLFINVWATWSRPCVKEIPDLKRLYKEYSKKGIDFLSLSVDLTSKIDSDVLPFIKKHDIDFPVNVIEEKSGAEILKLLDPRWSGGIPASFIFNKNGKRMIFILGTETFENLSKGIDSVSTL